MTPWDNLGQIYAQRLFLLKFTKILRFFWDVGVTLFDISKNAVFAEILVFRNIFGFSAIN